MTDIFTYDHETKEYLSKDKARICPVSKKDLRKRDSTFTPPPNFGENEIAVWDGAKWKVFPDFRAQAYWTKAGEKITITKIGETIPADASRVPPPKNNEELWSEIRAERDQRLEASDWSCLPDVPLSNEQKELWKKYRQDLRDITNSADPRNVIWPTSPA